MFHFLKNIKKSTDKQINLVILVSIVCLFVAMSLFGGCASQAKQQMDSNHYRAQAEQPQGYPCPECGFPIPDKDVSPNIRTENKCPNCQKIFFGTPVAESSKAANYQRGYGNYGPRNYGPTSVYQSDIGYQRLYSGGYSFKENSYGFTESYWHFRDSKVKSHRVIPHWRNTRYHYP